eukprot:TRINITY_DN5377_c0_g1_i1.p1 TRINITY_DN5377_c0_g1~~TRINITY_DN5377_c0_g1_i1.p1  ORF type:complete len:506 (-),score=107.09 TRINITY_DN5377_c0_g1_i1:6-1523(-)
MQIPEEICLVCQKDEDDELVLLCDVCDAPYHTYCLVPRLSSIPEGDWLCPTCAVKEKPTKRQRTPTPKSKDEKKGGRKKAKLGETKQADQLTRKKSKDGKDASKKKSEKVEIKQKSSSAVVDTEKETIKEFLDIFEAMKADEESGSKAFIGKGRAFAYEDELGKMLHSFGDAAIPYLETVHLIELLAYTYTKNLLDQIVQENLWRASDTSAKPKVSLQEVAALLPHQKKSRLKDVVLFLRRNKKIESTSRLVDENYFEGASKMLSILGIDPSFVEENATTKIAGEEEQEILIESFWGSIAASNDAEKTQDRKKRRLALRDRLTSRMTKDEYAHFSECVKVSFTRPSKRLKFSEWFKLDTYPISLPNECIDVLGQLLYDFVEDTIQGCLQLRRKEEGRENSKDEDHVPTTPVPPDLLERYLRSCSAKFQAEEAVSNAKHNDNGTSNKNIIDLDSVTEKDIEKLKPLMISLLSTDSQFRKDVTEILERIKQPSNNPTEAVVAPETTQ